MAEVTQEMIKAIRTDINNILEALAPKYGLKELKATNCSYTRGGTFTFKLEGIMAGGLSKEAQRYNTAAQFDSKLPPLGTVLKINGQSMMIVGMNSVATKVICDAENGKQYLVKRDAVYRLAAQKAA